MVYRAPTGNTPVRGRQGTEKAAPPWTRTVAGEIRLAAGRSTRTSAGLRIGHSRLGLFTSCPTSRTVVACIAWRRGAPIGRRSDCARGCRRPPLRAQPLVVHRDTAREHLLEAGRRSYGRRRGRRPIRPGAHRQGHGVGTPAYMSTERRGRDRVDGRSDLYALACVLYEMLVASSIHGRNAEGDHRRRFLGPPIPLRQRRPEFPALRRVDEKALALDPAIDSRVRRNSRALAAPNGLRETRIPRRRDRPSWQVPQRGGMAVIACSPCARAADAAGRRSTGAVAALSKETETAPSRRRQRVASGHRLAGRTGGRG